MADIVMTLIGRAEVAIANAIEEDKEAILARLPFLIRLGVRENWDTLMGNVGKWGEAAINSAVAEVESLTVGQVVGPTLDGLRTTTIGQLVNRFSQENP